MSTNKMREALEQAHDLSLDGRHEEARAAISEALAADDAARGTMREEFEAWCVRNGYPTDYTPEAECGVEGGPVYRDTRTHAAWWAYREGQASRAAAPQSVEPVWIQPDHLQKARRAPFLCRVEPAQRDDFVPLYTSPPAAPTDAEWEAEHMRLVQDYRVAEGREQAIATFEALRAHLSTRPAQAEEPGESVCATCGGLVSDPVIVQPAAQGELTDEKIDACLPLGIAPYSTLVGQAEIRRFARAVIAAYRAEVERLLKGEA